MLPMAVAAEPRACLSLIEEYGHRRPADVWFGLDLAQQEGRVRPGSLALLVSSGLGASWAATLVEYRAPHRR